MKGSTTAKEEEESEKICKRCKTTYLPSSNTPSSCRFHPSFFVCRRHDDQKRRVDQVEIVYLLRAILGGSPFVVALNVDLNDNVNLGRYYELGPDDPPYAAKFYDCCGAEDPEAPGCSLGSHVSYDEQ